MPRIPLALPAVAAAAAILIARRWRRSDRTELARSQAARQRAAQAQGGGQSDRR